MYLVQKPHGQNFSESAAYFVLITQNISHLAQTCSDDADELSKSVKKKLKTKYKGRVCDGNE